MSKEIRYPRKRRELWEEVSNMWLYNKEEAEPYGYQEAHDKCGGKNRRGLSSAMNR